MGYMIMPCLGLKLAANLEKTFMLDKTEPDHIFLLTVRLTEFVFNSVYLLALSLLSWLGLRAAARSTRSQLEQSPDAYHFTPRVTGHSPGRGELTGLLWWQRLASESGLVDRLWHATWLPYQEMGWKRGRANQDLHFVQSQTRRSAGTVRGVYVTLYLGGHEFKPHAGCGDYWKQIN